jgi:hypothetical protein
MNIRLTQVSADADYVLNLEGNVMPYMSKPKYVNED